MHEICCLGKRVINYALKMMTAHNIQEFLLQFFFFIAFFSFVITLFFSFTFEQSSYRSDCKPNEFEILGREDAISSRKLLLRGHLHPRDLFIRVSFHKSKI